MFKSTKNYLSRNFLPVILMIFGTLTAGVGQILAEGCNQIKNLEERKTCWIDKAKAGEKDLRKAYLDRADLNGLDLSEADLSGADLSGANLKNADLSKAKLNGAHLDRAALPAADLTGADLSNSSLQAADLSDAILTGVIVMRTRVNTSTRGIDLADWKRRGALDVTASVD
jgi:uncharacterized protein YjbI with pentapeptide repeats